MPDQRNTHITSKLSWSKMSSWRIDHMLVLSKSIVSLAVKFVAVAE